MMKDERRKERREEMRETTESVLKMAEMQGEGKMEMEDGNECIILKDEMDLKDEMRCDMSDEIKGVDSRGRSMAKERAKEKE